MSSDIDVGAETLISWADRVQPILALATALKAMGSIEQATQERQTAYQGAVAIHEDIKLQIADAEAKLTDLETRQASDITTQRTIAEAMVADAKSHVDGITADAALRALGIIADANDTAARIAQAQADASVSANADLVKTQAALADAQAALAAALAQLSDTQAKIDALKLQAQSILTPGGP